MANTNESITTPADCDADLLTRRELISEVTRLRAKLDREEALRAGAAVDELIADLEQEWRPFRLSWKSCSQETRDEIRLRWTQIVRRAQ